MLPSPCKRQCNVKPGTFTCTGCFRTTYEIQSWVSLTEEQQAGIINRVKPSIEMKKLLNSLIQYYDGNIIDHKLKDILDNARNFKD